MPRWLPVRKQFAAGSSTQFVLQPIRFSSSRFLSDIVGEWSVGPSPECERHAREEQDDQQQNEDDAFYRTCSAHMVMDGSSESARQSSVL